MRFFGKLALSAIALSMVAAPVSAQAWKWDFGVNAGWSKFTNFLTQDETGLSEETPSSDMRFSSGGLLGAQLGYWFGPKFGIRANLRYADRAVKGSDMPDDFDFIEHVNLWGGTGDLLFRFKAPADEYAGMEFLPYLAIGAGGKWHNPAGDEFTCNDPEEDKSWACGIFTTGAPGPNQQQWAMGEQKVFAGLVGLGADWRLSRNFAIRTELNDQIFQPQVHKSSGPVTGTAFTLTDGDENEAKWVHELGAQVGLHFLFGVPRPVAVAVVPAPPPVVQEPPPPVVTAPPPPPPPAPTREAVTVCVIDPTAPGGIRMETTAFYMSNAPRDTMITVNGQEVLLRNAVGNVMVAQNADWYVRGQPLSIMVGKEKVEFVTTGTARMVESSDLAFLGTINGMAIYADKDDVTDIREEIDELNRANRGSDLAKILEEHKDLREDLAKVKTFYVPLQPTGCVFQAVLQQEQVRKNKQQ
jgi:hypothetical protein